MNSCEKPRIGAVIQARMGSSRFPGKVLEDLGGAPMLQSLVDRLQLVPELSVILVATSQGSRDDPIEHYCTSHDVACFRGSEGDVLGRFVGAARATGLDVVVRVCADAPLTDPTGIQRLVEAFNSGDYRFVHNRHPRGWPVGTAADLVTTEALAEADNKADLAHQREHVTPYLVENPEFFSTYCVAGQPSWLSPSYHLAVDYRDDLDWMRRLFSGLAKPATQISIPDILSWIAATDDAPRLFEWPTNGATA